MINDERFVSISVRNTKYNYKDEASLEYSMFHAVVMNDSEFYNYLAIQAIGNICPVQYRGPLPCYTFSEALCA